MKLDIQPEITEIKRYRKRKDPKKQKIITIVVLIVVAVVAIITIAAIITAIGNSNGKNNGGITVVTATPTTEPSSTQKIEESTEPTPTVSPTSKTEVPDMTDLKKELKTYLEGNKGVYGIYYLNLSNDSEFGINEKKEYFASTASRIPLNLYLYKQFETGDEKQTTKIKYLKEDYESGTGSIQSKKFGESFSLSDLSKLSLEQNDTIATNMLQRHLGGRSVIRTFMRKLGGINALGEKNISCPQDMALYMKELYKFSKSDYKPARTLISSINKAAYSVGGIKELLPLGVSVGRVMCNFWDSGWGTVVNDIGIVYTDEPYIIAIMTKQVSGDKVNEIISNISKKVYDFVSKN